LTAFLSRRRKSGDRVELRNRVIQNVKHLNTRLDKERACSSAVGGTLRVNSMVNKVILCACLVAAAAAQSPPTPLDPARNLHAETVHVHKLLPEE
jgi:hypothetical protein